jgi:hypothetical protein
VECSGGLEEGSGRRAFGDCGQGWPWAEGASAGGARMGSPMTASRQVSSGSEREGLLGRSSGGGARRQAL